MAVTPVKDFSRKTVHKAPLQGVGNHISLAKHFPPNLSAQLKWAY